MFEEYVGFDESKMGQTGNNGNRAMEDGKADFIYYNDFMAPRHRGKGSMVYWDGHGALLDAVKMNTYVPKSPDPNKRYAATVAYGARH
jgi:prepilin-type processing-associated H-X9-DG protein